MKIFLTGASGFIGSAIIKELINAGHEVLGLVRTEEDAKSLVATGAKPHIGDITNLESLQKGASLSDGVIHTAFNHDFSKFKENAENDRHAIEAMGDVFIGSDKPLIVTSAIALLPQGQLVNEDTVPVAGHNPRIASEEAANSVAGRGVKISVVRLSPSVHGEGDRGGFIPTLIKIAKQKSISVYAENGLNYWCAVHRLDVAKLFMLAVEKTANGGMHYHGVGEEDVLFQDIAEAIGRGLNIPVVSKSKEESVMHFGSFAHFAALNIRASSDKTQQTLGWQPKHTGLIADINAGFYFA